MNFEKPNVQDVVHEDGVEHGMKTAIEKLRSRGLRMAERYRKSKKAAVFALATLAASTAYAQESNSPGVYESGMDPSVVETLGGDESRFASERANIDPNSYFFEGGGSSMQRAIELAQEIGIDTNEGEQITALFVGNVPVEINGVSTIDRLTTDELLQVHQYNEMAEIMEQHTAHIDTPDESDTVLSNTERDRIEETLSQSFSSTEERVEQTLETDEHDLTPEERAEQPLSNSQPRNSSSDRAAQPLPQTQGTNPKNQVDRRQGGRVFESDAINPDAY